MERNNQYALTLLFLSISSSTQASGVRPSLMDTTLPAPEVEVETKYKPIQTTTVKLINPKTRHNAKPSLLSQVPIRFGTWTLQTESKNGGNVGCVLNHSRIDFGDGRGVSNLDLSVHSNMLRIQASSPIDLLGVDHHIKIDKGDPIYFEVIERNTAHIKLSYIALVEQMKSGLKAQISTAFWPNSKDALKVDIDFNPIDFKKAYKVFSRCQKILENT